MGEHDDIEIRDLHEDIELIKSKATNCKDFEIIFIDGANHNYELTLRKTFPQSPNLSAY
jgi:hypothetical protein